MRHDDRGMTLVELLVATVLMGVLGTLAVTTIRGYTAETGQRDLAQRTVSALRNVNSRAVAEEHSICVRVDTTSQQLVMWQTATCGGAGSQVLLKAEGSSRFSSPSFASGADLTFYARGSSTGGTVAVTRADGSSRTYTISIEPLTSRVTYA